MRVLLLAGPPGSGKNTVAGALVNRQNAVHRELVAATASFARKLRAQAAGLYGLSVCRVEDFDADKDVLRPELYGLSWRQALIAVSERLVKPVHGEEFYGRELVHEIRRRDADGWELVVVHDSGFAPEARPVAELWPTARIELRRTGAGYDGDSRAAWDGSHLLAGQPPRRAAVLAANFADLGYVQNDYAVSDAVEEIARRLREWPQSAPAFQLDLPFPDPESPR